MITLGVVADTHIPDRIRALPPALFAALEGVDAILHLGDLSVRRVLDELARIAPVHAVAGNRDFLVRGLPQDRVLTFDGVRLGLTHGHGGWRGYALWKFEYVLWGYRWPPLKRQLLARFTGVDAVLFGHTHRSVNERDGGVLLFNPGSVAPEYFAPFHGPTVGRLRISDGALQAEMLPLAP